jgi:hypothetical protein
MNKILKKQNFLKLLFILTLFLNFTFLALSFSPVYAECPSNVVPNPLDPNCDGAPITIGTIVNRFIVFLPYIIVIIAVIGYGYGAGVAILGGEEGREKAIKIWVDVTFGLLFNWFGIIYSVINYRF